MRHGRLGTINWADRLAILTLDACHVQTARTGPSHLSRDEETILRRDDITPRRCELRRHIPNCPPAAAAAGSCESARRYGPESSLGPISVGGMLVREGGEDAVVRGPPLRLPHQVVEDIRVWDVPAANEVIPTKASQQRLIVECES
jgi:hypothetical protein